MVIASWYRFEFPGFHLQGTAIICKYVETVSQIFVQQNIIFLIVKSQLSISGNPGTYFPIYYFGIFPFYRYPGFRTLRNLLQSPVFLWHRRHLGCPHPKAVFPPGLYPQFLRIIMKFKTIVLYSKYIHI